MSKISYLIQAERLIRSTYSPYFKPLKISKAHGPVIQSPEEAYDLLTEHMRSYVDSLPSIGVSRGVDYQAYDVVACTEGYKNLENLGNERTSSPLKARVQIRVRKGLSTPTGSRTD
jgi:hypothetical protein